MGAHGFPRTARRAGCGETVTARLRYRLSRLLVFEPATFVAGAPDFVARRDALISKNVYLQMLGQTQFLNIAQIQQQRDDWKTQNNLPVSMVCILQCEKSIPRCVVLICLVNHLSCQYIFDQVQKCLLSDKHKT